MSDRWNKARRTLPQVQQESLDTEPVPGSESGHLLVANAAPCGPRGKWARAEPRSSEHMTAAAAALAVALAVAPGPDPASYSTEPTEFDSGICHGSWLCRCLTAVLRAQDWVLNHVHCPSVEAFTSRQQPGSQFSSEIRRVHGQPLL